MKFQKSVFAYLLIVGVIFTASCGVPGPPLPTFATTPEESDDESDRRKGPMVQSSPSPVPSLSPAPAAQSKKKTKKR